MRGAGFLSLHGVDKRFPLKEGELHVLDDISLDIRQGEFVSIVGGTDPARGIVFQDHRLYPWLTVEDNVLLALANSPLDKAERLARAQLQDELARIWQTEGITTVLSPTTSTRRCCSATGWW